MIGLSQKKWANRVARMLNVKICYSPTPEWWSQFLLKLVDHFDNEFPLSLLDLPVGNLPDSWQVVDDLVGWLNTTDLPRHQRDFRGYIDDT